MFSASRLQASRREYKYLIDPSTAEAIREFVRCYLAPDPFRSADGQPGYPVCSIYLDTPRLTLYGQTCRGDKNRFKLRIRYYDDEQTHPAFAEIKRRETEVIRKKRAAVSRAGAQQVLQGLPPSTSMLFPGSDRVKGMAALYEFCRLRDGIGAVGCTYVYYRREAFVSPDRNDVRVTFDRDLLAGPYNGATGLRIPRDARRASMGGVVLELKFTDRFPNWMMALVKTFDLDRQSVPKYVICVDTLGIPAPPEYMGPLLPSPR